MNYTLKELLDITRLQDLLDSLDQVSSMPSAILDADGTILIASSWQDICTKFHRVNPETNSMCRESDKQINASLSDNISYVSYRCPMGLIDAAMPLMIESQHLGNVFVGQFFLKPPDEDTFITQAQRYGFDEHEYLAAMRKVPVFSEEQLRKNLIFIGKLAHMLAEQGLQHKRQCEAENALRSNEQTLLKLKETLQTQYEALRHNEESLRVKIEEYAVTQKQLQDSEERFKALHNASFGGIIIHDKGLILDCNQGLSDMTGFTLDELVGMNGLSLISPEWLDLVLQNIQCGYEKSYEVEGLRKDGSRYPLAIRGKNIPYKKHNARVIEFRDITEHKRTEKALRQEQLFAKKLLESLPGIFYLYSYPELKLVLWNKNHETLLGFSSDEMKDRHLFAWHLSEARDAVQAAIEMVMEQGISSAEAPLVAKDGSLVPFHLTGVKLEVDGTSYLMGIGIDISERKHAEEERIKLEQQFLHAQKLESLGILAGGIAHDFNNILLAIIGNADLALMRINKESPAVENLHRIEQAAARAADLAKQMLAYSGKGRFVVENINLNRLLEEMLHMLGVSISKKAVLRLNPYQSLPSVAVDATQMRQIVMNLVINASEAIGEKSGFITITTGCMDCDRSYLKDVWLDENLKEGLYVYLEIADTGCGMDKETKAKLFDPFFTTKFTGRGLGMAAVLGIVRGHKGAIKVYSELQKGTSFKILLPASNRPADLFTTLTLQDAWQGSGTVLLVDDEESVRGIGVEMLKELGFTAITAENGREAVARFNQTPDISFVILDLTMPHMDGEQCFRELRQLKPDLKIIISSGYNEQEVSQKFTGKGLTGFIQKPYNLAVLRDIIRRTTT